MLRVLVAGDAMLDRYWFGDVSRISPEAPVPVVAVAREEEREGGAANVARNIEAMGPLVNKLYSASYAVDPVIKLRVIGRNQQMVRIDFDRPQAPIDPRAVAEQAAGCGIAVLSDYRKGALAGVREIIAACKAAGAVVLVDPKGHRCDAYRGADVIKPNLAEMHELVGSWDSEAELEDKAEGLRAAAGIGAVLLTRGPDGMTLFDGTRTHIPAQAREVYDVSGAGDTAIAALAAALARGMDLHAAAWRANRAAGIAVGRFGTTVVEGHEVFKL